jgi:hypothetical protein
MTRRHGLPKASFSHYAQTDGSFTKLIRPADSGWVAPPDQVHTKILMLLRAGAAEELRRRHQVEERGFLELLLNDNDDDDDLMQMIMTIRNRQ